MHCELILCTISLWLAGPAQPSETESIRVMPPQIQGVAPRDMMKQHLLGRVNAASERWQADFERRQTPEAIGEYQARVRAKFLEAIGGLPERTPLEPKIVGTLDRDGYRVEKVLFEDIRIEDLALPARRFGKPPEFAKIGVSTDMWATDKERGHIRDIILRDVQVGGTTSTSSSILGADAEHGVDRVTLERIRFLGRMATSPDDLNLKTNAFAREITVQ